MKKTTQAHLTIEAASHPGMTGKQNEDRFGVTAFMGGTDEKMPVVLAVLCDGIGGHRAGEVAAEMGVSIITEEVTAGDIRQPLQALERAIYRASAAVYQASQANLGRAGMGATCACAWVIGDRLYTANLGDSRIYLLRSGHFIQLTTDHTWIQEALDAGIISDAQGENHPNAHVIRRYLGSKGTPEPDFRLWFFAGEDDRAALGNQGLPLLPGDILLLCSDGLTDLVADPEIQAVLEAQPLTAAPEALIGLANARGGHDNTTVVMMQVPQGKGARNGKPKRRWVMGCVIALAVAGLLVTAALVGWRWWEQRPAPELTPALTQTLAVEATAVLWTATPTVTQTLFPNGGQPAMDVTPQPSITPWPTDTVAP